MAWAFQGVLNAGVQILLSIAGGWLCGRLRLVDPDALSASLNTFAMKSCFPAFVIHLLGIKADLQDAAAWRFVEQGAWSSCTAYGEAAAVARSNCRCTAPALLLLSVLLESPVVEHTHTYT
jgi:predicted permease